MRLRVILLCFIAAFTVAATAKTQHKNMPENSNQSAEVQKLIGDNQSLEKPINDFRTDEDKWNRRNRNFTMAAVLFGGLLGIIAWYSQRSAANAGRLARPLVDRREANDKRIQEIKDQESELAIAQAEDAAGKANRIAEEEKLERIRLEASIAPRQLSLDQRTAIGKACAGITTKPVGIRSYAMDPEGYVLALHIKSALNSGGIHTALNLASSEVFGGFDMGVVITSSATDAPEAEFASCLAESLRTIGKLTDVRVSTLGPKGSPVDVLVAVKPIPPEALK